MVRWPVNNIPLNTSPRDFILPWNLAFFTLDFLWNLTYISLFINKLVCIKWMYNDMYLYPLCHFLLTLGPTCSFCFNLHCHLQKFISPQLWGSTWRATYHWKRHDLYYPSMGFLFASVNSFMSIYFNQLWGPKSNG